MRRWFWALYLVCKHQPAAAYYGALCLGYAILEIARIVFVSELHAPVTAMTYLMLACCFAALGWIFMLTGQMIRILDQQNASYSRRKKRELAEKQAAERLAIQEDIDKAVESIERDKNR